MRIVATTGNGLRHRLLLSMLVDAVGDSLTGVLIQVRPPVPQPMRATVLARSVRARARRGRTPLVGLWRPAAESVEERLRLLAEPRAPIELSELPSQVEVIETADPNADPVLEWVRRLEPDLVLVFGGSILRGDWLTVPKVGALNLHYGILPAYRGSRSTEFALYHDRFDLVGATVHYVDAGVDSGPVVRRVNVDPRSAASLEDCKARVYLGGMEALVESVRSICETGARLRAEDQEKVAPPYRGADWSPTVEVVARTRLDAAQREFPAFHRALEVAPRRRQIAGRLPFGSFPPGLYVLLYHSVVDPVSAQPWEIAFTKVSTSLARFEEQLRFISRHMTPVALEDAPELFRVRPPERPFVAVTFDDGYANLLTAAAPICTELGFRPTVFVNATFAAQRATHYRVHLAELIRRGKAKETAAIFAEQFPASGFHAENLWALAKDHYSRGATETATAEAWSALAGDEQLAAHLTFDGIRELQRMGWSVGNHTLTHVPLVGLDDSVLEEEVTGNRGALLAGGLNPIDWLSYPYGRIETTDPALGRFMEAHPQLNGIYASGGVNLAPSRAEWARIGVGDGDARELRTKLIVEARATLSAWSDLARR